MSIELKEVRRELQSGARVDTTVAMSSAVDSDGFDTAAASINVPSAVPSTHVSSAEHIISGIKQHRVAVAIVGGVLVFVIAAIGIGLYKFVGWKKSASLPTLKLQPLTTSGRASDAAISPGGKYVAHVKSDAGQQSLWLRQVVNASDTQIIPPSTESYFGITFSKDGNYIYYVQGDFNNEGSRTLYQVGTLGGAPRKVIEGVNSPVSLSPDGSRLAFIRRNAESGETALVIANADGTGEKSGQLDSIQSRLLRSINISHRLQPLRSTSGNTLSHLFAVIHVTNLPQRVRATRLPHVVLIYFDAEYHSISRAANNRPTRTQ